MVRITLTLLPTFQSLPKTSEGRLQSAAVRYLLHRYFVDRHGWYVQGLEPGGQSWNSSSPTEVIRRHMGSEVQNIFEERLGTRGLSLHEVAVLTATLEGLVHREVLDRLHAAYGLSDVSDKQGDTSEGLMLHVIDNYMLMYVLGLNHTAMTRSDLHANALAVDEVYPHWKETQKWVRQVRAEVVASSAASRTAFGTTTRVLEEVADRYGRWQHTECSKLKDMLMKLEQPGTGRVPLATFYGAALAGNWQLMENKDYLRQMGSLDETDPQQPSVMIANYINGPSNCVASSAFYSVCCISECEALLGSLEREFAAPDVDPGRLARAVAALPSATVAAPRQLSADLESRLGDIAAQHGGRVPLHGRLFTQWLHHAYPRECPFPHVSGSLHPMTMERWLLHTGNDPVASEAYLRKQIEELRSNAQASKEQPDRSDDSRRLPWVEQEELLVSAAPPGATVHMELADVGQGLLLVATVVAVSMAMTLARSLSRAAVVAAQPRSKLSV